MSKRVMRGTVVSTSMPKTLVVEVFRLRKHPKYRKYMSVSKRFKAHYDEGTYAVGDTVAVEETRPISKDTHWRVIEKLSTGTLVSEPEQQ